MRKSLIAAVLAALADCGPSDAPGIGPSPVAFEEVRAKIASPTGVFDASTRDDVISEGRRAARVGAALEVLVTYLTGRLEAAFSGQPQAGAVVEPLVGSVTAAASDAFAWVRVACPGADLERPSVDFTMGSVRGDLSVPIGEGATTLIGYVRLTLAGCAVKTDVLDGVAHALFEDLEGAMRVTLSGDVSDLADGVSLGDVHAEAVLSQAGIEVLVDLAGGTFAVSPAPDALVVRAANGTFSCTAAADGGPVTCVEG